MGRDDVRGDGAPSAENGAWGDDVYQPDGSEVQDDEGLLTAQDTLVTERVEDPLDEGYSPPDRPLAVERKGVTAAEQQRGESLEQRLAEELPEVSPPDGDGIGDADIDGEPLDGEVGRARSGRLVAPDEGAHESAADMVARDVGIDGAAASAEEAAMHLVDEYEEEEVAEAERVAGTEAEGPQRAEKPSP